MDEELHPKAYVRRDYLSLPLITDSGTARPNCDVRVAGHGKTQRILESIITALAS